MSNFKIASLSQLAEIKNAHLQGLKRVFVTNDESETSLTQFAYGTFQPKQESGLHHHETMDEYFYFLKGNGHIIINNDLKIIAATTFIKVSAGVKHNLINAGDDNMEFIYFGIATV